MSGLSSRSGHEGVAVAPRGTLLFVIPEPEVCRCRVLATPKESLRRDPARHYGSRRERISSSELQL
jgi:hypothetical protein